MATSYIWIVAVVGPLGVPACGTDGAGEAIRPTRADPASAPADETDEATGGATDTGADLASGLDTGAWLPTLPENARDEAVSASVIVDGCVLSVGTATQIPPYPPLYLAYVQRGPADAAPPDSCGRGYVVLGESYDTPAVAIARHPRESLVVVDYSTKPTPSGTAHTQLYILQLAPDSGNVVRRATLAAMPTSPEYPQLGNVWNGELALDGAGTLTVAGEKDGAIPGEMGSGDRYVATYERFVLELGDAPAPTSVRAYTDAP